MKMFIKDVFVDLEKFHAFEYNEEKKKMVLYAVRFGVDHTGWSNLYIDMTKEEYDKFCNNISLFYKILQF